MIWAFWGSMWNFTGCKCLQGEVSILWAHSHPRIACPSPTFSASDWWISFRMTRTCLAALVTQIRQRLVPKKYVHPRLHHALDPGKLKIWDCKKKHNTSSNMSRLLLVIGPPCHGSVNVSWEDPSKFHRVPLGPLATDAWTSRTAIESIGTCRSRNIRGFLKVGILKSDLQNYIETSILGDILLSISPYFQPKKNSSSTEKTRWHQVILPGRPGRSYIKLWRRRGQAQFKGWCSPAAWTCSIGIQESRLRSQIARAGDFHNVSSFLLVYGHLRANEA
jgi:hypothetical protein